MSIYAIRGQAAFDRSRAEPAENPARDQSDAAWEALEQARAILAAAVSLMSRGLNTQAYAHIDDARALLNNVDTRTLS